MKKFKNLLMIIIGVACDGFGFAVFVLPNNFLAGGIAGLGRFFNHYTGIQVAHAVGAMSVTLLVIGFLSLGKEFAAKIIFGSILFPVFIDVFGKIPGLENLTDNMMLAAVFGGGISGFGLGLLIRAGSSSGGSDVIPVILNRKFGIPVAPVLYGTDLIILAMQLPFADVEDVLFGIVVSLICSLALDKVVIMGSSDVQFTIVSEKHQEINERLQKGLDVGSTLFAGKTGHLKNELDIIMCVVSHENVQKVKNSIMEIDPEAFITMVNVSDVKGRGFSMSRRWI